MKIKEFFMSEENIKRDSYLWNMAGSMLMAFQSVIMLMILTRTLGLEDAGVFTIAFANANLFLTIGKYGMRNFQVSDVKNQFTFAEYRMSRLITLIMMLAVSMAYTMYASVSNGYTTEKTQVIIWMCLFKAVDTVEDVYSGLYQRKNRLDVAAKIMTLRIIFTIIIFGLGLIIVSDLLLVLIISAVSTALLLIVFIHLTYSEFSIGKERIEKRNIFLLLKVCFPLFAGSFLSFYIGNAPKYAIDAMLTDELQACYGFIAMPVFVIGLLNNFIFNPMLFRMSVLWNEKKIKEFVYRTIMQTGIVAIIMIVCMLGAWLLGIPVLSWMYNTDLSQYKAELLILLLGGGFLGLSGLLNAVITIIRHQKSLMWGYVVMAVLAYIFSDRIVQQYKMMGAAVLYAVLMGGLCFIFAGLFVYGVVREKIISEKNFS